MENTESIFKGSHLLVVDDDPDIRELLADYLRQHGFCVEHAADGVEMMARLDADTFDLVVLDIMMPGEDGLEMCRKLRALPGKKGRVPVIFLTALGDFPDRVVGLELGADDYVVKPFQPRELLARIRAVLRRAGDANSAIEGLAGDREKHENQQNIYVSYAFEGWTLDTIARHLQNDQGLVVSLSGAEYRLLLLFLENPQAVLSRERLQEAVQGREVDRSPFDRSIDVQVCRLRARLGDNSRESRLIKTVRGDGYVFTAAVKGGGHP